MRQRTVGGLMTCGVVNVAPSDTFKDVVEVFADNHITAVPVTDDGNRVLGVVSEADLLRPEARQPEPSGRPRQTTAAVSPIAAVLMTSPAVVARSEWSVVEAARIMDIRKVKRLPVVDQTDRLVSLTSRAGLLRVLLRQDRAIREESTCGILADTFRVAPTDVIVHVLGGCVTMEVRVERSSAVLVLMRLCCGVGVSEELDTRLDDLEKAA